MSLCRFGYCEKIESFLWDRSNIVRQIAFIEWIWKECPNPRYNRFFCDSERNLLFNVIQMSTAFPFFSLNVNWYSNYKYRYVPDHLVL